MDQLLKRGQRIREGKTEQVPLHFVGGYISGCPMVIKGLECPVSKLVNSDARPRPTTQDAWGATKNQFKLWYMEKVKSVCDDSIDMLFGTTSDLSTPGPITFFKTACT
jgi:hypothetical protein